MTAVYIAKAAKDGGGNSFNAALQDQDGSGASVAGVHALRDSTGANINPATSDLQTVANAALASIAANTAAGTAITGAAMPSGGAGVTGWLSAIWTRLSGTLSVSAASLPLPANAAQEGGGNLATLAANSASAATAAAQAAGNVSLAAIASNSSAQATAANQATGNASLATIATNSATQATAANQTTGNASLTALSTATGAQADAAYVSGSGGVIALLKGIFGKVSGTLAVSGTFWQATQPVSGTFWQATQPVSGAISVANLPATQPVSAASLPLPTGAAQETGGNLATIATNSAAQATAANQATGNTSISAISTAAGTQADAAYAGSGSGSTISLLKWIGAAIKGTLSVSWAGLTVADGQTATGIAAVGKMLFNGATYDRARSGVVIGSTLVQPIDGAIGTGLVTSAAVLFSLDTSGYAGVSVLATAMPASNVVTFEGSNDNTNWTSVLAQSTGNSGYPPSAAAMAIGVPAWFIPAVTRYIRARVSTYASGTIAVAYALRSSSSALSVLGVQSGGGAMAIRATSINYGGLIKARIQSLATTNATSVKASGGQPYVIDVGNSGASDAWLKLYDKASAPTVGTDTPVASLYLPKGTARAINLTDIGVAFANGIAYAITGAAIDSDTTAVAVNQVTGMIAYT